VAAIATFLSDALAGDGSAVVIATPEHRAAVDAALTRAGFALASLAASGNYVVLDASDALCTFMDGDRPDAERFGASIGSVLDAAALRPGPVRLFGEMVALLWDRGAIEGAIELEAMWNDTADRHTFALFCAYAMSSLETSGDLDATKRMCDHHSSVIALSDIPEQNSHVGAHAGAEDYERLFVATPMALREVRYFVRGALTPWLADNEIEDAEIIASELATNAVKHARSPFRVALARSSDAIRISVRDASFAPPVRLTPDGLLVGGRGVQLVAALSRAWGICDEVDGKTVWAEIERPPVA
jgi:anti-sigma regulatory factor (Ser/Thr protein kinase)